MQLIHYNLIYTYKMYNIYICTYFHFYFIIEEYARPKASLPHLPIELSSSGATFL